MMRSEDIWALLSVAHTPDDARHRQAPRLFLGQPAQLVGRSREHRVIPTLTTKSIACGFQRVKARQSASGACFRICRSGRRICLEDDKAMLFVCREFSCILVSRKHVYLSVSLGTQKGDHPCLKRTKRPSWP